MIQNGQEQIKLQLFYSEKFARKITLLDFPISLKKYSSQTLQGTLISTLLSIVPMCHPLLYKTFGQKSAIFHTEQLLRQTCTLRMQRKAWAEQLQWKFEKTTTLTLAQVFWSHRSSTFATCLVGKTETKNYKGGKGLTYSLSIRPDRAQLERKLVERWWKTLDKLEPFLEILLLWPIY